MATDPPLTPLSDVERLRAQNHEHAERRDREMANLHSRIDEWENARRRACELVRGSPVDWTDAPGSQEPDGWWRYTSQNNRDILTAAVHDAGAQRDRLRAALDELVETAFALLNNVEHRDNPDDDDFTDVHRRIIWRARAALSDPTPEKP